MGHTNTHLQSNGDQPEPTIGQAFLVQAVAPPDSGDWSPSRITSDLQGLMQGFPGTWEVNPFDVRAAVPPVIIPEVPPAQPDRLRAAPPNVYVDQAGLSSLLDQLNADARALREALTQFDTDAAGENMTDDAVPACLERLHRQFEFEKLENDARIDRIAQITNTENDEIEVLAGILEEIKNQWRSVCRDWPQRTSTRQAALKESARSQLSLSLIIENTGYITSLQMVNRWLENARVGDIVTFEAIRGQELPDPAMRKTVLKRLKMTPTLVNGWIDTEKETIQRSGTGWQDSLIALLGLLLCLVGPLLVLYGWNQQSGSVSFGSFDFIAKDGTTDSGHFRAFAEFAVMALLGAAVPSFARLFTIRQSGGNVNFRDIWAHFVANQSNVWLGAIVVWVAIILVTVLNVDIGRGGAFFLGFSAEKVVASQLSRLQETAKNVVSPLTELATGS